jgi:O-antigen ligase
MPTTKSNPTIPLAFHEWLSGISSILMSIGMVCSRLLLSLGMILLFINALHPQRVKYHWNQFRSSNFAIFSLFFFVAYALSILWSGDKSDWIGIIQNKLPFLFFPFGLISLPLRNRQWFNLVTAGLLLSLLGGVCYSFYFLFLYPQIYTSGSHIPSPMEGDYIRFTLVLVLAMIFVVYLFRNQLALGITKPFRALLVFWAVMALAYICIQAAKTGVISFSIFYCFFVIHYGIKQRKYLKALGLLGLGIVGFLACSKLPAFSNQLNNVTYEHKIMETADTAGFNKSSSFVPRINSYKAAATVILNHPVIGVGAGDVMHAMDKAYDEKYPNLKTATKIIPHNVYLCSMLAIGIPLTLLTLVFLVFSPLLQKRHRTNIYFLTTWAILFFGMMIEPMLEVQFGIFVFLFFLYFWTAVPEYFKAADNSPA